MAKSLVDLFRIAGCPDPEGWARSQETEGIPQLARFLFLRQMWREILDEDDVAWIENVRTNTRRHPDAPYAGEGDALERLLAAGADPRDLTELVRCRQAELLFRFCYLLEDPSIEEPEFADMNWGLVQLDDEGENVIDRIGGLHESVLETDPTGREMRPRRRP